MPEDIFNLIVSDCGILVKKFLDAVWPQSE
jgi:hypothetical protein